MASERWGVSEAALCGKDQGFSSLPIKAGWLGWRGREENSGRKGKARAAGIDATHLICQRGFLGKDQNKPPGSGHDGATGLL